MHGRVCVRLASIELRNYRCFEHLEVELEDTTVIVGANDTGKSTLLEAIHGLLDPIEIDWDAVVRNPGLGSQVIGRFVDLPPDDEAALEPFVADGGLRIGVSSASGSDRWLIVTPEQARRISELVDRELVAEALAAGTVPAGFEQGIATNGPNGPEVWYWWWIWEFGTWGVLDAWGLPAESLHSVRPIRLGTSAATAWDPLAVIEPILRRHLARGVRCRAR